MKALASFAKQVVVTQPAPPEPPVKHEVLATAIVKISEAAQALARSGLNRAAIVTLLADKTKQPKHRIAAILDALEDLKRAYCR